MAARPLYETAVNIPYFAGINQTGDGYNLDLKYALECENVDFHNGQFKNVREGKRIAPPLPAACGTLTFLHASYEIDDSGGGVESVESVEPVESDEPVESSTESETVHMKPVSKDYLVAIAGGKLYTLLLDDPDATWVLRHSGLSTDYNSNVRYEMNGFFTEETGEPGSAALQVWVNTDAPVDVLIFSNAEDGMFCLYSHDLSVEFILTPQKYGVIARSNERIWGTAVKDLPDFLYYSTPYDPYNWLASPNPDTPEDGAGDLRAPSWDGDKFSALVPYNSQLLAIKRNSIWRITGTNPGEYVIREQSGQGTLVPNTVIASGAYAFMLGYSGIVRYDGNEAQPYLQDNVQLIMARVNYRYLDKACGALIDRTYYLSLPIDGSDINNAVLIYDSREQTFALRTRIYAGAFMTKDDRLFYSSSKYPEQIYEWAEVGDALPVYWKSGMQDLGLKSSIKSAFNIYFTAEADTPFDLIVGIRTEKKTKQKSVKVIPGKAHKLVINLSGRYFQLIMWSNTVVPFAIKGGVKIALELDPD